MASRQEIAAIYAAAVIQGIVLVTFPAVSSIFTSPQHFGFSTTEYGGLFTPQAIAAIVSSLLGAGLTRRIGGKSVFLIGLAADLLSLTLLFVSQFATDNHLLAYGLILAATGFLGIGFGFTVPSLNTFTAAFFPAKVDQAILTLNALLGLGTALAPIFAAIFVGLHIWWGLPLLMGILTVALIAFSLPLPLDAYASKRQRQKLALTPEFSQKPSPINRLEESGDVSGQAFAKPGSGYLAGSITPQRTPASSPTSKEVNRIEATKPPSGKRRKGGIPTRFWLYAGFALLYGVGETLNGNWATVYMSHDLAASTTLASLALTAFWVAVTAGRVLFAAIEKWLPEPITYRVLPILLAVSFIAIAAVPSGQPILGIVAFALAGLACSALLPLVISFAQGELTTMSTAVAGAMIGFYQIGYGIAAFGAGPLQTNLHLSLASIFRASALAALLLTALAFLIASRKNPSSA